MNIKNDKAFDNFVIPLQITHSTFRFKSKDFTNSQQVPPNTSQVRRVIAAGFASLLNPAQNCPKIITRKLLQVFLHVVHGPRNWNVHDIGLLSLMVPTETFSDVDRRGRLQNSCNDRGDGQGDR